VIEQIEVCAVQANRSVRRQASDRQVWAVCWTNTAGRVPGVAEALPGVDLRGDGGYVVAPPSRHAAGRPYRWASDANLEPAPTPAWLRPAPAAIFPTAPARPAVPLAAGGSRYGLAALGREIADVRRAVVGERNNRLNRAAFSLGMLAAGRELDEDLVEDELLAAALVAGLQNGKPEPASAAASERAPKNHADDPPAEPPAHATPKARASRQAGGDIDRREALLTLPLQQLP
jgi:hypothetical protein